MKPIRFNICKALKIADYISVAGVAIFLLGAVLALIFDQTGVNFNLTWMFWVGMGMALSNLLLPVIQYIIEKINKFYSKSDPDEERKAKFAELKERFKKHLTDDNENIYQ